MADYGYVLLMPVDTTRMLPAYAMNSKLEEDHLHTWASVACQAMEARMLVLHLLRSATDPAIFSEASWLILEARVSQASLLCPRSNRSSNRRLLHIKCLNLLRIYSSRVLSKALILINLP